MSRRSHAILLVGLAALASATAWWIAGREPRAGTASLATPSTAGASRTEPELEVPEDPLAADTVPSTAPTREIARTTPDRELEDAWWVEGRVILPPDTPPDEHVEVVAKGSRFKTRELHRSPIEPDGSFRVAFAASTRAGDLVLSARYLYLPSPRTLRIGESDEKIVLEPLLGGVLHGRLVLGKSALGRASSLVGKGVRVRATGPDASESSPGRKEFRVLTLSNTLEFETGSLAPGPCRLSVQPLLGVVSMEGDVISIHPGQVEHATVLVERTASVAGIVVNPAGTPLPDAKVTLEWVDTGNAAHTIPSFPRTARVDGAGAFRFPELEPGTVRLQATSPGWFESAIVPLRLHPGEALRGQRLGLRAGGSISGAVRRVDGTPAAGVNVLLELEASPALDRESKGHSLFGRDTDLDGRFAFRELGPGEYGIRAGGRAVEELDDHDGPVAALDGIRIVEGGSVSGLELHLLEPGRIEGRVVPPTGVPAGVALVWPASGRTFVPQWAQVRDTDTFGNFVMEGIAPGPIRLAAQRGRMASLPVPPVTVESGQTVHVDIELVPGTLLYVAVQDEVGREIEARIDLDAASGWSELPWRIQDSYLPDGFYPESEPGERGRMLGPLPPGDYTVRATDELGRTADEPVHLAGQSKERRVIRLAGRR